MSDEHPTVAESPGAWVKIQWTPKNGQLHFESNMQHVELLGILEMTKHVLLRQMASGMGAGVLAKGSVQQPALQVRRVGPTN